MKEELHYGSENISEFKAIACPMISCSVSCLSVQSLPHKNSLSAAAKRALARFIKMKLQSTCLQSLLCFKSLTGIDSFVLFV